MLDFRMETFITVCEFMNFTKAADELHITQPAVSQHIRYIEREYGIRLFHFQGKKMFLTEKGKVLLDVAMTQKNDDLALRRVFAEKQEERHTLIFGVTMTIGEYVIGDYLASYMKKHPETEVKLTVANTEELLARLDAGDLDFALVEGYFEKSKYDFEVFRREKYIGICASSHSLAQKKHIKWPDLFQFTFIGREKGSGTREVLERALNGEGYSIDNFKRIAEISNMSAIKMTVINRCGITFLYEAAVSKELEEGKLKILDLEGFPLEHDFTFIWRKNSIFGEKYKSILAQMKGE